MFLCFHSLPNCTKTTLSTSLMKRETNSLAEMGVVDLQHEVMGRNYQENKLRESSLAKGLGIPGSLLKLGLKGKAWDTPGQTRRVP